MCVKKYSINTRAQRPTETCLRVDRVMARKKDVVWSVEVLLCFYALVEGERITYRRRNITLSTSGLPRTRHTKGDHSEIHVLGRVEAPILPAERLKCGFLRVKIQTYMYESTYLRKNAKTFGSSLFDWHAAPSSRLCRCGPINALFLHKVLFIELKWHGARWRKISSTDSNRTYGCNFRLCTAIAIGCIFMPMSLQGFQGSNFNVAVAQLTSDLY